MEVKNRRKTENYPPGVHCIVGVQHEEALIKGLQPEKYGIELENFSLTDSYRKLLKLAAETDKFYTVL